MRLKPANRQPCLEQDALRCRKVRLHIPHAFVPVPPGTHPPVDDRVDVFMLGSERFTATRFGPGPQREMTDEAPGPTVFFLVPYLN